MLAQALLNWKMHDKLPDSHAGNGTRSAALSFEGTAVMGSQVRGDEGACHGLPVDHRGMSFQEIQRLFWLKEKHVAHGPLTGLWGRAPELFTGKLPRVFRLADSPTPGAILCHLLTQVCMDGNRALASWGSNGCGIAVCLEEAGIQATVVPLGARQRTPGTAGFADRLEACRTLPSTGASVLPKNRAS
jgi:hypothetical protein